jgi:hypothetical protein
MQNARPGYPQLPSKCQSTLATRTAPVKPGGVRTAAGHGAAAAVVVVAAAPDRIAADSDDKCHTPMF